MKWLCIIPLILLSSCIMELPDGPVFDINEDKLYGTEELSAPVKYVMNGVYSVRHGKGLLGDEVVCRWVRNKWCIYSKHDVVFSESSAGFLADSLIMTGYIRIIRSGSGMQVDFYVKPGEGGKELKEGKKPADLKIYGTASEGTHIELVWNRPLYNGKFYVIAHRGGGRNSERLGISENSIEMIQHAERLGANGVEIDIKRTRDNELILFHDDTFSPRTVMGAYLLGKVENFDLEQIKLFGRLVNGEEIPTLNEALTAIIKQTTLSLVWIDIKEAGLVEAAIKIRSNMIDLAANENRDIKILLGMPDEDVLNGWNNSREKENSEILIEKYSNDVLDKPQCKVWAPRWTDDPEKYRLQVQGAGKLVFTWTLDMYDYIDDYWELDGILTNYPSLLAGMYYSK